MDTTIISLIISLRSPVTCGCRETRSLRATKGDISQWTQTNSDQFGCLISSRTNTAADSFSPQWVQNSCFITRIHPRRTRCWVAFVCNSSNLPPPDGPGASRTVQDRTWRTVRHRRQSSSLAFASVVALNIDRSLFSVWLSIWTFVTDLSPSSVRRFQLVTHVPLCVRLPTALMTLRTFAGPEITFLVLPACCCCASGSCDVIISLRHDTQLEKCWLGCCVSQFRTEWLSFVMVKFILFLRWRWSHTVNSDQPEGLRSLCEIFSVLQLLVTEDIDEESTSLIPPDEEPDRSWLSTFWRRTAAFSSQKRLSAPVDG